MPRPRSTSAPASRRVALIWVGVAVGVAAAIVAGLKEGYGTDTLLALFVGWSFTASGIAAWIRRPENPVGALMVTIGIVWFASQLFRHGGGSIGLTFGIWIGDLWLPPLAFLLAGFPLMRLETTLDRVIVGALFFVAVPLEALWLMFAGLRQLRASPGCPQNAMQVWDAPGVADTVDTVQRVILISVAGDARRGPRAPLPQRERTAAAGARPGARRSGGDGDVRRRLPARQARARPRAAVPTRAADADRGPGDLPRRPAARPPRPLGRGRAARRPARADRPRRAAGLARPGAARPDVSSSPTGCPSTRPTSRQDGEPLQLPTDGRVATLVERRGTPVAAIIHDATLQDEPELVGAVASAAGIALENERLQADLRARLSDLRASRARIVEAGDTARRKLERDLHDGAQQRLVSLSVVLRLIAGKVPADSQEAELLAMAREELNASLEELRNIARGIHPAILSDHGLPVALESLAARAPVRVELDARPSRTARRRRSRSPRTT